MPTVLDSAFQHNPYENTTFTGGRKIVFGLDMADRLQSLDAGAFAARIKATREGCQALSEALGSTGSALSQQTGATTLTNEKLDAVRYAIGSNAPVVKKRVKGDAALLKKIFTGHVTYFTADLNHGNAAQRMDEMTKNLAANPTLVTPEISKEINDAIAAYWADRKTQGEEKSAVTGGRLGTGKAEIALNQVLWLNECALVQTYPAVDQLADRQAATNHSLLLAPAGGPHAHTYADYLPHGMVADVVAGPLPLPTARLVLINPGAVRVCFALSASPTEFPATGAVEIAPGAQQKMKLQDLGDPLLLPYLLAKNPTSELGQYKAVLG